MAAQDVQARPSTHTAVGLDLIWKLWEWVQTQWLKADLPSPVLLLEMIIKQEN